MNEIESPAILKYAGDLFFVILFLIVFFFYKPGRNEENESSENLSEEEKPNPLEEILQSDENQDAQNNEKADSDETSKKISTLIIQSANFSALVQNQPFGAK